MRRTNGLRSACAISWSGSANRSCSTIFLSTCGAGEILGLVGASGGGKSVLLRTIIGLLAKRSGSIEVLGIDLERANQQEALAIGRRWGILFQQGALFSSLTVRQNVQFPMRENLSICPIGCSTSSPTPSSKWSG